MRSSTRHICAATLALALVGCTGAADGPAAPAFEVSEAALPHVNLNVVLRGEGHGFVRFRQPPDDEVIVNLDTRVRGLSPHASYQLQRAVDAVVDDDCTSTTWLTLGKGPTPQAILTDGLGNGQEQLWRSVSPVGATFDIHFRVIDAATAAVVLQSECYQFVISR
jgi:hypothetical protein